MGKDDNPNYILASGATFPILTIILVSLRFYARNKQGARYGPDDWLALLAVIFLVAQGIVIIIGIKERAVGFSNAQFFESPWTAKIEYAFQPIQILTIGCTKLSFVFFYRRVFVTGNSKRNLFSKVTWAMIVLLTSWTLAFTFAMLFNCGKDVDAQWTGENTRCDNPISPQNALGISDFITDCFVFLLPIPMILGLQMTKGRKLAVFAVFGFGSLAVAASCTRMIIWWVLSHGLPTNILNVTSGINPNFLLTDSIYWGSLEAGLSVTACCLPSVYGLITTPSLRAAIQRIRGTLSWSSHKTQNSANNKNFQTLSGERHSSSDSGVTSSHTTFYEAV
jgi:hypothetical protein